MIKQWKNCPTSNVSFPLGRHHCMKKKFQGILSIFIVAPLLFLNLLWFLMYNWNIKPTLQVSFFTITFKDITMKIANIYVSITTFTSLIPMMKDNQ